jgi:hypothetical protein
MHILHGNDAVPSGNTLDIKEAWIPAPRRRHRCRDRARPSSEYDLPGEAGPIAEGDHAFAHLLSLIEDRDELSDDLWASLHDSVGTAFGKPIAAAAARAKIGLPLEHAAAAGNGRS